jgi:hypothetical protein
MFRVPSFAHIDEVVKVAGIVGRLEPRHHKAVYVRFDAFVEGACPGIVCLGLSEVAGVNIGLQAIDRCHHVVDDALTYVP